MKKGYIALSTVLVIGLILFTAGMAVVLNSINQSQSSLSIYQKEKLIGFGESCVEDSLLTLNETGSLPTSVVLPDGTCTVTMNSQTGNDWDFSVVATLGGYKKTINVNVTRTTTITINSWLEI